MIVFGDTSGFFAFLSADDSSHERMKQSFRRLLRERAVIRTTSYVLIETLAQSNGSARTFIAGECAACFKKTAAI